MWALWVWVWACIFNRGPLMVSVLWQICTDMLDLLDMLDMLDLLSKSHCCAKTVRLVREAVVIALQWAVECVSACLTPWYWASHM